MTPLTDHVAEDALRFSAAMHEKLALGKRFTVGEFRSRDWADLILIHPALVTGLIMIRRHFAVPVHINSAYRTEAHNRAIGGKSGSYHLTGMAADITVRGIDPSAVSAYAEEIGFGGIGRYRSFTHVDVGPRRRW